MLLHGRSHTPRERAQEVGQDRSLAGSDNDLSWHARMHLSLA